MYTMKKSFGPLLLMMFMVAAPFADAACQSCVFLPAHHHHRKSMSPLWGKVSSVIQQSTRYATLKQVVLHRVSKSVTTRPVVAATAVGLTCFLPVAVAHRRRTHRPWIYSADSEQANEGTEDSVDSEESGAEAKPVEEAVSTGMISALGFYKTFISPILPPACRFVPTCSQYGVQAIKEFGPGKGSVLIAWRLMRCSPFGGKGFDPPQWPPVSYTYGSW